MRDGIWCRCRNIPPILDVRKDIRDGTGRRDRAIHVALFDLLCIPSRNSRYECVVVSGAVEDTLHKSEMRGDAFERWEVQTGARDIRFPFCFSRRIILEQAVRVRKCIWCRCKRIAHIQDVGGCILEMLGTGGIARCTFHEWFRSIYHLGTGGTSASLYMMPL